MRDDISVKELHVPQIEKSCSCDFNDLADMDEKHIPDNIIKDKSTAEM